MDQGTFEMSQWEREKMVVLEAVRRGEISVRGAARRLKISRRHAIRLKQRYLAGGAVSLTHRARGRPGNRRPREPFDRRQVIGLYPIFDSRSGDLMVPDGGQGQFKGFKRRAGQKPM